MVGGLGPAPAGNPSAESAHLCAHPRDTITSAPAAELQPEP
jgi:hypothetical protein